MFSAFSIATKLITPPRPQVHPRPLDPRRVGLHLVGVKPLQGLVLGDAPVHGEYLQRAFVLQLLRQLGDRAGLQGLTEAVYGVMGKPALKARAGNNIPAIIPSKTYRDHT